MSEDKNDQINDDAISNLSQEQDHQSQPDKLETTEEAIPTGSEMSQDSSNVGTSNAVEQSPQSDAYPELGMEVTSIFDRSRL